MKDDIFTLRFIAVVINLERNFGKFVYNSTFVSTSVAMKQHIDDVAKKK